MMYPMLPFVLSCLAFGVLFVVIEITSRRAGARLTPDDTRKAVHILAGLMAAMLPFVLNFAQISALGLFFIGFMTVSKATHLFPSIHGVKRLTLGEIYYPLAIALVAWLFPNPVVYTYAILVLALADGFAAVVGVRVGQHTYSWLGGNKSYEGSAVCWAISFSITVATLSVAAVPVAFVILISIVIACCLTIVESNLSSGLDNLALPLTAAAIMQLVL